MHIVITDDLTQIRWLTNMYNGVQHCRFRLCFKIIAKNNISVFAKRALFLYFNER